MEWEPWGLGTFISFLYVSVSKSHSKFESVCQKSRTPYNSQYLLSSYKRDFKMNTVDPYHVEFFQQLSEDCPLTYLPKPGPWFEYVVPEFQRGLIPMLKSWISTQRKPLNLCSIGDCHWVKCKWQLCGLSSPLAFPLSESWQERHPCLFKEQNSYLK